VKYGIAAKRIKSANNLMKNVKKAIEQISKSKIPGIIVLETSLAFNPDNVRVTRPIGDTDFLPLYKDIVNHHWTPYDERTLALMRDTNVRGIIIHEQLVRFEPSGEWSLIGMTIHRAALHAEPREMCAFKSFAEVYENGLPNRLNLG
jgi:hypothetical protein